MFSLSVLALASVLGGALVGPVGGSMALSCPTSNGLMVFEGIDGSGKGYVASQLVAALISRGLRAEVINLDGWLNLPQLRFDPVRPAVKPASRRTPR